MNTYNKSVGSRKFGHSRPVRKFNNRRGGGGKRQVRIDERLFINKAVPVNEEMYTPKHAFSDFPIHEALLRNINKKGYIHPSPIQDQAIPLGLSGRDVIGVAATGTGKTAAFLIPLINKLIENKAAKVMILAPTRELAQQIEKEFRMFAYGTGLWSVTCVGGMPINKQIRELERGVHIVIGTPGRIQDLIDRKKIHMSQFTSIVLDEVDRMLDMGFIDDMRYILKLLPKEHQSFFFSATLSPEINNLCQSFLHNPETISIKSRPTANNVDQDVIRIPNKAQKVEVLHDILIQPHCSKVLIFREMKRSVDELAKELQARGFKALALHGDMRNRERARAVQALGNGSTQIVIATDVAARGIDIPDITHVINYDIPSTYDTYIHRIGRTGRGKASGTALTFI